MDTALHKCQRKWTQLTFYIVIQLVMQRRTSQNKKTSVQAWSTDERLQQSSLHSWGKFSARGERNNLRNKVKLSPSLRTPHRAKVGSVFNHHFLQTLSKSEQMSATPSGETWKSGGSPFSQDSTDRQLQSSMYCTVVYLDQTDFKFWVRPAPKIRPINA